MEKEKTYTVFSIHIPETIRIKYEQSCEKVTLDTALPENEKLPPSFLLGEHRSMTGQKLSLSLAALRQEGKKTNLP